MNNINYMILYLQYILEKLKLRRMDDKTYLSFQFYRKMKKELNLDNPITFNEKLQWLKLYDRQDYYTKLVDKNLAKETVGKIIGNEYIIPTLGVYEKFEDIDFSKLPEKFVMKCTHDSGGIVICRDKSKLNLKKAKKKIDKSLKNNYYYQWREWPYKNIEPKIIIEQYMEDGLNSQLNDYKMMCFNGKVKCSFVCTDRDNKKEGLAVTFYDINWNKMSFRRHYRNDKNEIEKPKNYEKMIELTEKICEKIKFARVDWYEIKGKLYFGEVTFFPGAGMEEFEPYVYDIKFGNMINLGEKNEKNNGINVNI